MFRMIVSAGAVALVSGAAAAADLPMREAPPPPPVLAAPPIFTFTGFYAGTHTAYTMTDRQSIRRRWRRSSNGATSSAPSGR